MFEYWIGEPDVQLLSPCLIALFCSQPFFGLGPLNLQIFLVFGMFYPVPFVMNVVEFLLKGMQFFLPLVASC